MYLKKSDIEKNFTPELAREFSKCIPRKFAYQYAVTSGGPVARIGNICNISNTTFIKYFSDEGYPLIDHIRKNFKNITIRNLHCTEQFHPELNLTVRKLNPYYSYYGTNSEGSTNDPSVSMFEVYVSSDVEEYTELDQDTRLIVSEPDYDRDINESDGDATWFLVRDHEMGMWVVKFESLLNMMFEGEEKFSWMQKNLKYGFLANEEIFLKLEKSVPEKLLNRYYTCKQEVDKSEGVLNKNNAIYNFWYHTKEGKVRAGDWRISKSEYNQNEKSVRYTFSNGHATISSVMPDSIRWTGVENLSEEEVISGIVRMFSKCSPNKNIRINGIDILYSFSERSYRMKMFGHMIRYAEEEPILRSLCCFRSEEVMQGFVEDCSKLSLNYRMILSEGIKTTAYLYRRGNSRREILEHSSSEVIEAPSRSFCDEEFRHQLELTYDDNCEYSGCVLSPVRFKFQRREKGRGLNLVLTDGTTYKVKPKVLLSARCNKGRTFRFLRRSLGPEVTPAQIREIIEDAAKYFEQAKKASEELLRAVMEELGATKTQIKVGKNQNNDAYVVVGKSKTEYAVIDEGPKYPVYRKTSDGSWRFVCIESSSDISQEVGKDGIVTRLYALINDTDHTDDIYTLKGIAS